MAKRRKHEIVAAALAYARCSCGWEYRNFGGTKGKSDEDLAIETGQAFVDHQTSPEE
jgi:hypothetical protein